MSDHMMQPCNYRVGKTTFIVTPVYATAKGESLTSILLNLMKADMDKISAASTSLTEEGRRGIINTEILLA